MRFSNWRTNITRLFLIIVGYMVCLHLHRVLVNQDSDTPPPFKKGHFMDASQLEVVNNKFHSHILESKRRETKDNLVEENHVEKRDENGLVKEQTVRSNGALTDILFDEQRVRAEKPFHFPPVKSNQPFPLFQNEDSTQQNDRIINQMRYVPKQIILKTSKTKRLLMYNGLAGEIGGREGFIKKKCPVQDCILSGSRSEAAEADVIVWQHHVERPFHKRPPGQIWAVYFLESPYHTPITSSLPDSINWTATYRHDSTIVSPYYKFTRYNVLEPLRHPTINYAKGKTKMVAWFVSNCGAVNRRLQYAKELAQYIEVDIYGACGTHQCPRMNTNACFDLLKKEYKFYLAFENSNCRDYITEKFFLNALSNTVIPIAMGAHPDDYKRQAPPNSFIHVDDFQSPAKLAEYLKYLSTNDTAYNSYFAWRGMGLVDTNTYFTCRLCMMAHEADNIPVSSRFSYANIKSWWVDNICVTGSWPKS